MKRTSSLDESSPIKLPSSAKKTGKEDDSTIKSGDIKSKKGISGNKIELESVSTDSTIKSKTTKSDYGTIDKSKPKISVAAEPIDSDLVSRFRANQRKEEIKIANSLKVNKKLTPYELFCLHVKRFMRLMFLIVIVTVLTLGGISLKSRNSNKNNDDNSNIVIVETDDHTVVDDAPIVNDDTIIYDKDDTIIYNNDDTPEVFIVYDDYDDIPEEIVITPSEKPHIIFLLADDLGWNSIGYEEYDLTFATPYLSEYAAKGIIMDNYYAQEVCTPSRAKLFSGGSTIH